MTNNFHAIQKRSMYKVDRRGGDTKIVLQDITKLYSRDTYDNMISMYKIDRKVEGRVPKMYTRTEPPWPQPALDNFLKNEFWTPLPPPAPTTYNFKHRSVHTCITWILLIMWPQRPVPWPVQPRRSAPQSVLAAQRSAQKQSCVNLILNGPRVYPSERFLDPPQPPPLSIFYTTKLVLIKHYLG